VGRVDGIVKRKFGGISCNCEDNVWEDLGGIVKRMFGGDGGIVMMTGGEISWNCEEDMWENLVEM